MKTIVAVVYIRLEMPDACDAEKGAIIRLKPLDNVFNSWWLTELVSDVKEKE